MSLQMINPVQQATYNIFINSIMLEKVIDFMSSAFEHENLKKAL